MQVSKLLLIAFLAGLAAHQLQAQPASPELQSKALELLRQTLSQNRVQPPSGTRTTLPIGLVPVQPAAQPTVPGAPTPTPPETVTPAPAPAPSTRPSAPTAVTPAPAPAPQTVMPSPAPNTAASNDLHQQALGLLRQKVAENEAAAAATTKPSSAKSSKSQKGVQAPTTTTPAPVAPATGAKTKQQRLMDLLEEYRADKLTPAEYHAKRAQILAEP